MRFVYLGEPAKSMTGKPSNTHIPTQAHMQVKEETKMTPADMVEKRIETEMGCHGD